MQFGQSLREAISIRDATGPPGARLVEAGKTRWTYTIVAATGDHAVRRQPLDHEDLKAREVRTGGEPACRKVGRACEGKTTPRPLALLPALRAVIARRVDPPSAGLEVAGRRSRSKGTEPAPRRRRYESRAPLTATDLPGEVWHGPARAPSYSAAGSRAPPGSSPGGTGGRGGGVPPLSTSRVYPPSRVFCSRLSILSV